MLFGYSMIIDRQKQTNHRLDFSNIIVNMQMCISKRILSASTVSTSPSKSLSSPTETQTVTEGNALESRYANGYLNAWHPVNIG